MKPTTRCSSAVLLLLISACGGSPDDQSTSSHAAASAGAGGSGPAGSTGSGSTSGSGAGGGSGKSVTLKMTPFTVPSGGEVYKCQNFANPFGAEAEVSAFESHMTPGSHHMLLFYKEG